MVVQIYKKRRKCALWNLKIRAPQPPTAEKTHGHRRGEKKKRDAGEKTGKKPAKQGRFRRFLPRFSFFLPFFLSSRRGKRNVDGEERTSFLPDSQLTPMKGERFLEQERKRSCNFLWKFKTLSVYSRCGCPFAASFSQAQGQRRQTPRASIAPHSADRRAHPGRTPAGPNGVARAAPLLLKNAPESSPERHWA